MVPEYFRRHHFSPILYVEMQKHALPTKYIDIWENTEKKR